MTKLISLISLASRVKLIFMATVAVLIGSIPIVYLSSIVGNVEYNFFLFSISVVLPLLLTPPLLFVLITLTVNLQHVKEHLEEEIEKNKSKDIILYEQSRFVTMGEMMANISHQWKQPLNTINLAVLNAKLNQNNSKNMEYYFDIVENNVNYLAETINDFMSYFDRRSHSELKPLSMIIKEVRSIIDGSLKKEGVILNINFSSELEGIEVASSLSQVLLNLITNSKDALSSSKVEKKIGIDILQASNSLEIILYDNGKGISEDIKENIFSPYFTTKEKSQGTGIGLYMSKQIINKFFGGDLTLLENKKDTCFKIHLPFSDKCKYKESN